MTLKFLIPATAATLILAGCASTERGYNNMSSGERGAVGGAVLGAGAGAIIAGRGDDAEGALIGSGIGAAAGYMLGNERDKRNAAPGYQQGVQQGYPQGVQQGTQAAPRYYTDERTGRLYYIDPATGTSYFRNGERRY